VVDDDFSLTAPVHRATETIERLSDEVTRSFAGMVGQSRVLLPGPTNPKSPLEIRLFAGATAEVTPSCCRWAPRSAKSETLAVGVRSSSDER